MAGITMAAMLFLIFYLVFLVFFQSEGCKLYVFTDE